MTQFYKMSLSLSLSVGVGVDASVDVGVGCGLRTCMLYTVALANKTKNPATPQRLLEGSQGG